MGTLDSINDTLNAIVEHHTDHKEVIEMINVIVNLLYEQTGRPTKAQFKRKFRHFNLTVTVEYNI